MGLPSIQEASELSNRESHDSLVPAECYVFARFRLYPKQRRLLLDGAIVDIGGRAFDVLLLLVSRAGHIVSASEFTKFVWPNSIVEEANLRVQIGLVRKLLSQCEEASSAIETVSLRGYCFVIPTRHLTGPTEYPRRDSYIKSSIPDLLVPIFGRASDVELIADALTNRRLVTITGPGGIGKSVVAIATAHRRAADFDEITIFVDLSQVVDSASAAAAITAALKIETTRDGISELCDHLQNRDVLLVLDTCEHIVEPMANLVEILLNRCANLRLLATSREALRATGEWTHRLPSLTFPAESEMLTDENLTTFSGVAMFIERVCSSVRSEFKSQDMPIIADICRRLDGIPLALELAAARVPELGLAMVAAHLDDCCAILTRGRRTALPRHQTLSAAIDWSYRLLSDAEQRLLRQLATLGRRFGADEAIAVAGGEHALDGLANLYEKSLITVEIVHNEPVYRVPDTMRAYVSSIKAN